MDLGAIEMQRPLRGREVHRHRDVLLIDRGHQFPHHLIGALLQIAFPEIRTFPLPVARAQLKQGLYQPGQPVGAGMNALDRILLGMGQFADFTAAQKRAVAANGSEGSAKIVRGTGQEVSALVLVFLQFQVGLHDALQNFVAVAAQRSQIPLGILECRLAQKSHQSRPANGLQQDVGGAVRRRRPEAVQVMSAYQKKVLRQTSALHPRGE